ncbi:MAG TPA: hypothetical protein VFV50_04370 [Bdellovibrionales bacterium]|nr:hypothetical protein [Bdellovibrionales bacterium]
MAAKIEVELKGAIARPVDEVRSQFFDIEHHAKQGVHPDLKFTILKKEPNLIEFRQEVKLLGMRHDDQYLCKKLEDGSLYQEVIAGTNKGLTIQFWFESLAEQACVVRAKFVAPTPGLMRFLAPLLKIAIRKTAEKAFLEDKKDLESGNYHRLASGGRRL